MENDMPTNASARLNKIKAVITPKAMIDVGYPVFVKNTPIKTGNARRHTSKTSSEIDALYPYALRLDQGYSHQNPDGMIKPTIQAIRDYIRNKLG